jgi:hypothetical protein
MSPAYSEDVLHNARRIEPLVTEPSQSSLSVAVESFLMGCCFVECVLFSLLLGRYYLGQKNATFGDVSTAVTIKNVF